MFLLILWNMSQSHVIKEIYLFNFAFIFAFFILGFNSNILKIL